MHAGPKTFLKNDGKKFLKHFICEYIFLSLCLFTACFWGMKEIVQQLLTRGVGKVYSTCINIVRQNVTVYDFM